jgi:DNA repair exonuclease SbcCD ATPase subunit
MAETIDVLEAARRLGVTPDAVRAKLRRGTLEGYRDNSGNWRIVSNDTTADTTRDTTPEPARHDTDTTRHDVVSPDLARLLKALMERVEADQARLIEERDHLRDDLQEARAEADHAKSDQVRMAQDVAGMFDELRTLTEKHADHAAELEQVRDELERSRQDAGLWREETDRERARIANLQADAEHTEREMTRLQMELEQARRPWWRRLVGR